jgi:hypothetical protein
LKIDTSRRSFQHLLEKIAPLFGKLCFEITEWFEKIPMRLLNCSVAVLSVVSVLIIGVHSFLYGINVLVAYMGKLGYVEFI